MKVTVFLIDVFGDTKVGSCRQDLKDKLNDLYRNCFNFANARTPAPTPPHTFEIVWADQRPTPADTDVVIYFIPSDCGSIVAKWRGKQLENLGQGHWGRTEVKWEQAQQARTNFAVSEVRTMTFQGKALGAVAFHEVLHHKLLLGNDLHSRGGLAAATVDENSTLNEQNRRDIADTISRPIKQWTDGWKYLSDAKALRANGDLYWYRLGG